MFDFWGWNLLDVFQVYLLATGLYYLFIYLKGTRAAQILIGVGSLFIVILLLTFFLELDVVNVVLRWMSLTLLLALLVVFQPELRRIFTMLGRNAYIQLLQGKLPDTPIEIVARSARSLAVRRIGALIAIERTVSLDSWCETGTTLDALTSEELMISIFTPPLPLHDGGVIIRGDRIRAAHCIFPIDNELRLERAGTRHRAALTLSTECDALILIVSEERGQISVARDGYLLRNLSDRQLERLLRAAFVPQEQQKNFFSLVFGPRHNVPWFLKPFMRLAPTQEEEDEHHA